MLKNIFNKNLFSRFYQKTVAERQNIVANTFKSVNRDVLNTGGLTLVRADSMVENCIGVLALPLGLG